MKAKEANGLEIVFVSADQDEDAFNGYYGEQPWVATIFGADANEALNGRFDVSGIPTLVVLNGETGALIDANARTTVASNIGNVDAALSKWN